VNEGRRTSFIERLENLYAFLIKERVYLGNVKLCWFPFSELLEADNIKL
jgi:hypothetical protein